MSAPVVAFAAVWRTETIWDVTIDGITVKIDEPHMEELVKRWLARNKFHATDDDGKTVMLKGLHR